MSATKTATSSEHRENNLEPVKLTSSPLLKTGDIGITQWSPLSLSEIPPCTVDSSCHDNSHATQMENNIVTEQLQSVSGSGQPVRPSLKIIDTGFTKKKRKFVYTVETSKTQAQGQEMQSPKIDPPTGIPDSGKTFFMHLIVFTYKML